MNPNPYGLESLSSKRGGCQFIVSAEGHAPVTTHIFVADSPYLDSDAVFAVKRSLVQDFAETDDPAPAREFGVANPFRHARFDFVLEPA